jgi:2-dehydro-3-deoxygluconokinase
VPDVVTFGESMGLLVTEPAAPLRRAHTFARSIAGAESNLAVGLTRLGHSAGWFGRVGDDAFGHGILDVLRAEGVDVSRAIVDPEAPTGILIRDRHAERRIHVLYYRHGSAGSRLCLDDVDLSYLTSAKVIHLTGITPALSDSCHATVAGAIEQARRHGVTVSFDPNLRLRLWTAERAAETIAGLVANVDIVLIGHGEAERLTGRASYKDAASFFIDRGAGLVVVKLGEQGSWATDGTREWSAPAHPVTLVDPVGAGDAFDAGFLSGRLRGFDVQRCLAEANVVGAMSVQVPGDIEGLPYRADVDAVLADEREVDR